MPVTPSAATRSTVAVLNRQRFKAARRVLLPQWTVVSGDVVEVTKGREKGKQGVVKAVLRRENRLLIDAVNVRPRTISATPQAMGFVKMLPSPVHVSAVQLVDPLSKKGTRVHTAVDSSGRRVRVSRSSGAVIPRPAEQASKARGHRAVNTATDTPASAVGAKSLGPIDVDAIAAYLRQRSDEWRQRKADEEAAQAEQRRQTKAHSALSHPLDPAQPSDALRLSPSIDRASSSPTSPTPPSPSSAGVPPWLTPSRRHFPARLPSLPPFPYQKASALVGQWAAVHQRRTAPPGVEYTVKP